tara:strand:+ start:341 stop:730 length:390 start_codon:yes stop_codon:yes gene_type:complete
MKKTSPTRSRDRALQSLYEADLAELSIDEILENNEQKSNEYYISLVEGVLNKKDKLDSIILENTNRKISDIDPIERNILRIAILELSDSSMDQTILISEGIRMAKKYGSVEGYKFVNAVLDKYLKLKAQ